MAELEPIHIWALKPVLLLMMLVLVHRGRLCWTLGHTHDAAHKGYKAVYLPGFPRETEPTGCHRERDLF